ncbi:MAG: cation:proton antiporter [Acidobacteria bacterium]|nr:cation:proton antiporter [Acidobacteriota bacterium]
MVVCILFPLIGRFKTVEPVSRAFQAIIFWGGLRGALAIVIALSIPAELEQRSFILALMLGVVLLSLFINGLTIRHVISIVGLDPYTLKERYERLQAMVMAVKEVVGKNGVSRTSRSDSQRSFHLPEVSLRKRDSRIERGPGTAHPGAEFFPI